MGKDPEIRYDKKNNPIANLSIGTNEEWKDRNTGQKNQRTEWHRVVIFGPLAKVAQDYVKKGTLLYLDGKLQTRKWQDQTGQDRYTTEIVLDGFSGKLEILRQPEDKQNMVPVATGQQPNQPANTGQQPNQPASPEQQNMDQWDTDIPF